MARLYYKPARYGTYHNICVYEMHGEAFVRKASSLTGDRVKKDPAFAHTMANAHRLVTAARLAVAVYDMLAPSRRKRFNYKNMVGRALRLLKAGHTEGETVVELMIYIRLPKRKRKKRIPVVRLRPAAKVRAMALPVRPTTRHLFPRRLFQKTALHT